MGKEDIKNNKGADTSDSPEVVALKKQVAEQQAMISALETSALSNGMQKAQPNPILTSNGKKYEVLIPVCNLPGHGIITIDDLNADEKLVEKLVAMGYGGLRLMD